ncbi:hypothetical protein NPIL_406031 [Nephila pilipes]|uniref:Uncharacterized protein n=1 Tax=Nephila pilipes TaxID=299642 RepID=A0A8X6NNR3_NEPPI|nr:hypothetical protein NPIL_406031 [Nephila pilipes]
MPVQVSTSSGHRCGVPVECPPRRDIDVNSRVPVQVSTSSRRCGDGVPVQVSHSSGYRCEWWGQFRVSHKSGISVNSGECRSGVHTRRGM